LLTDYITTYKKVNSEQLATNSEWKTFFEELENIYEKVNIAEFGVNDFPVKMHEEIDLSVAQKKSDYQRFAQQLQGLVESHKVESHKVEEYQRDVKDLKSKIQNLESKISEIDPSKITKLKEEKKSLQEQQSALKIQINNEEMKKFYDTHENLFDDFKFSEESISN
jgi:chromosome segregation ATPase